MGNPCCKITNQPITEEAAASKVKKVRQRRQDNESRGSSLDLGASYKQNTIKEMKLKEINPQYFCRKSKIIPEISSMYQRETEYSARWSNIGASHWEANADIKDSVILQVFQSKYLPGKEVKYGDTIVLRNLKQANYLFCKYEKHAKFDKKNLVKLEEELTDQNEMYLTWKIIQPQRGATKEASSNIRANPVSLREREKVILEHASTGCFLETNKNFKLSQRSPINLGLLVSCGQPNKIVNDQQWEIELLQADPNESRIAVNSLFKLRHCETSTYLCAISDQVCCLESMAEQNGLHQAESMLQGKNDKLLQTSEEKEEKKQHMQNHNSMYLKELHAVHQETLLNNEHPRKKSPSLRDSQDRRQEQIKIHQLIGQDDVLDIPEEFPVFKMNNKKNGKLLKDCDQDNNNMDKQLVTQQADSCYISDANKSNNAQDFDEIQALLNRQINNQLFQLNMLTEITEKEEKVKLMKQLEVFSKAAQNSDIWYVSEVLAAPL